MARLNGLASVVYFGKLPSRGDFVRSTREAALVHTLDDWLARGMDLLAGDVRWKLSYDEASAASFALMGSRSRIALSGHLTPSFDASRRRFPFITAHSIDVDEPMRFIARSPLILSTAWARLARLTDSAFAADDAGPALDAIGDAELANDADGDALDARYAHFLDNSSVGDLQASLDSARHTLSMRRAVLALGMLLRPLVGAPSAKLDKGLLLPLPAGDEPQALVAALWCDLVARFLARSDLEISMFVSRFDLRPGMLLGFNGASARAFQSLIDPMACRENTVAISNADWVDELVAYDYGLRKLSDYMEQPDLTLRQMCATFGETFLGA